jgi:hypothetical protein
MVTKSSTPKRKPNGLHAEQINEMQSLTPRAAAWLADVPASTLRDSTATIPPDADGNYDAREVAQWAIARRLCRVTDDDLEMVHRAADSMMMNPNAGIGPTSRVLKEMRDQYGRSADSWFVDVILSSSVPAECEASEPLPKLSDQELLSRAKIAYEEALSWRAEQRLDVSHVCECGKIRSGNRWVKRKLKPSEQTIESVCNDCSKSSYLADPFVVDIRDLID